MAAAGSAGQSGVTYAGYMWVAKRDNNGYAKGTAADPNAVSNDTVYPAYILNNTVSFTPGAKTKPKIDFYGAQVKQGSIFLNTLDPGDIAVVLNSADDTFRALVENNSVDTVATNVTITGDNPNGQPVPMVVGFCYSTLNLGTLQEEWITLTFPNCSIREDQAPAAALQTGDATNPSNITYTITPSLTTRAADGRLISAMGLNNEGNVAYGIGYRANKPFTLATWIADGVETDFDLAYLPTTSDATGADRNLMTLNGTQSTVTSVSTSTANVVIAAAGTAADIWQVLHTTDFATP